MKSIPANAYEVHSVQRIGLLLLTADPDLQQIIDRRTGRPFGTAENSKTRPDAAIANFDLGASRKVTWGLNATIAEVEAMPDRNFILSPTAFEPSFELVL